MIEHEIDLPTADGAMNTFVVHPDEGGPHPVVLFYMDAPGKREELHQMARRLASAGYCVLLPNLYHRRSRDYQLKERTEAELAVMFAHMNSLTRATTEVDTAALLAFADQLPAADASRIGAMGYCMSGPFVMWAAAAFPERIRCIAAIHGARLVTDEPDSPHRMVGRIRCEAYFGCASDDPYAPPELVATLEAALKAAGTRHRIEWYPDTGHGFVFPQRGAVYRPAAAERHWARLHALFRRHLG